MEVFGLLFFCMDSKTKNRKELQGIGVCSIKTAILALSATSAFSAYANSKFIPPGFEHFYEYQSNQIVFVLPNETRTSISVVSNFDGIKTIEEPEKLKQALKRSGVASDHIDAVLQTVVEEQKSDENILYVYDHSQKQVLIEVPANYLSEGMTDLGFTQLSEDRRALISTNRLFTTHYQSSTSATLTNNSTIGFGRSHVDLEASLYVVDNSSSQLDVDELAYTYDLEGSSIKAYETHRGNTAENSTSIFNFNREEETVGISYFSNDNLLVKDIGNTKKLFFDMKARGTIEVLRGGQIIYTNSVSKGQHSVSYRDLPRGNYEVLQ
ncbi:TcfC E-set like domain-containing protein [Vibrio owensii]